MAGKRFTFGKISTEEGVTSRRSLFEKMTIGNPDCPIFERFTVFRHPKIGAIRVHDWYANSLDLNIHDHPWGVHHHRLAWKL